MKKGHSKLLLNDILVPETRAPAFVAGMDITMMTVSNLPSAYSSLSERYVLAALQE